MPTADLFPNLDIAAYRETSKQTEEYNCVAWAAGFSDAWWDPADGYFWPVGVPRDGSIETLVKLCESLGFSKCASDGLENGFQKVAVYGDPLGYTHIARQLSSGKWTSKLGALEDVEHGAPSCLVGTEYGQVVHILKRAISAPSSGSPSAH